MLDIKIPTLIIEKDQQALNESVAVFEKFNELSIVGKATSGKQGYELGNNHIPILVVINVELPDVSGVEFVRMLRKRNILPAIVFLAKDEKKAFESLSLEPFDYFVKPFDDSVVAEMITSLKMEIRKREMYRKLDKFTQSEAITTKRLFPQKKGVVILSPDEIVFCKAEKNNTSLKLQDRENVIVKTGISETLEIINNSNFIRVGRSNIINLSYLRRIDKKKLKCILYSEGQAWEVPISKNTVRLLEKMNLQPI